MSKIITAWVETYTVNERKELIHYLCAHDKFACVNYPVDGYQIMQITFEPGFGMTIPHDAKDKKAIGNDKVFPSAQSYIDYCETGIDRYA